MPCHCQSGAIVMTLLGLDFDNTLVRYDKLFHQLAVEKGLLYLTTKQQGVWLENSGSRTS